MISSKTDAAHRHNFDLLKGSEFYPGKRYGKIKQIHFFKTGICKKKSLSPDKTTMKIEMVIMITIVFISNHII